MGMYPVDIDILLDHIQENGYPSADRNRKALSDNTRPHH